MRFTFAAIAVALACTALPAFSDAELSQREREFSEALYDMSALVKGGINRYDLKGGIKDLSIKYDRYVRSGGDKYSRLYDALKSYRAADERWDEQTRILATDYDPGAKAKLVRLSEELIQGELETAQTALENYRAEQRRRAALTSGARDPKPAKNQRNRVAPEDPPNTIYSETKKQVDALKAELEAGDADTKRKLRELRLQRACLYTSPPSCRD